MSTTTQTPEPVGTVRARRPSRPLALALAGVVLTAVTFTGGIVVGRATAGEAGTTGGGGPGVGRGPMGGQPGPGAPPGGGVQNS